LLTAVRIPKWVEINEICHSGSEEKTPKFHRNLSHTSRNYCMASKFSMAAIRNSDKPQEAMRRGDGRPCTAHVAPSDAAFPRPYLIHMNGPSRISRGLHMITILQHVPHDCMIIACLLKCLFNYMHSSSQVPAVSCLLLPVDRTTAVRHRVTTPLRDKVCSRAPPARCLDEKWFCLRAPNRERTARI
jgi:hypothetical protein